MSAAAPDLFATPPVPVPRRAPTVGASVTPRPAGDDRAHRCAICGADAAFGFGVFLRRGRTGRWACLEHRDDVEGLAE